MPGWCVHKLYVLRGALKSLLASRFDIYDFEFDPRTHRDDEQGLLKSMYALNRIITNEVDAGTPSDRIVLGGFSQGGAMTLLTGLTNERSLAGLAVMSGWAPALKTLKPVRSRHLLC